MWTGQDFAAVADDLCLAAGKGTCTAEGAYRAAIGRYYYAALLTARGVLEAQGPLLVNRFSDSSHKQVIDALADRQDPPAKLAANSLKQLRDLRNAADYGDAIHDPNRTAQRASSLCREVLKWLGGMRPRA